MTMKLIGNCRIMPGQRDVSTTRGNFGAIYILPAKLPTTFYFCPRCGGVEDFFSPKNRLNPPS